MKLWKNKKQTIIKHEPRHITDHEEREMMAPVPNWTPNPITDFIPEKWVKFEVKNRSPFYPDHFSPPPKTDD